MRSANHSRDRGKESDNRGKDGDRSKQVKQGDRGDRGDRGKEQVRQGDRGDRGKEQVRQGDRGDRSKEQVRQSDRGKPSQPQQQPRQQPRQTGQQPSRQPPKPQPPKITFASVLGKKEELVQVKESVDSGFSTAPLAKYVPLQLPRYEAEFQTWVMYNFEHILDMQSIIVDCNEDELYYTSFHFLDALAHFLFDHSTKNIDPELCIVESDELDEYLVKRDRESYKE